MVAEIEKLVGEAENLSVQEKTELDRLEKEREETTQKFEQRRRELQQRLNEAVNQTQAQVSLLQGLGGRLGIAEIVPIKKTRLPKAATGKDAIINLLQARGKANFSEIGDALKKNGYKSNPGVILGKLAKDKVIKRVDRGVYAL